MNQFYDAEIIKEYIIKGNAAVLKCSIPSFVADFVYVESWIDEEGTVYEHSDSYGVFVVHIDVEHFTDFIQSNENTEGVSIFSQQNNIPKKMTKKNQQKPNFTLFKVPSNEWN